ncbi:MAG: PorT family protein [Prolixibacteraceae bacterium]|nr:PorT family protein [Prolixibacteraceae bacterium]
MTRLIILFFLISLMGKLNAQSPFGEAKERFMKNVYFIELTGGVILPSYNFFDTSYDDLYGDVFYNQTGALAFRTQFRQHFSFSPRISYDIKGGAYPSNYNDFEVKSHYLSLLTPIEFNGYFSEKRKITKPGWLLYLGPYVSYGLGGSLKNAEVEYDLEPEDFNTFDAGFEVGIGLRIPTFSFTGMGNFTLKAAFYHGVVNSYPEKQTSRIADFGEIMYSENGTRYNMGLRFTISYEIALLKKEMPTYTAGGDGKRSYKKFIVK